MTGFAPNNCFFSNSTKRTHHILRRLQKVKRRTPAISAMRVTAPNKTDSYGGKIFAEPTSPTALLPGTLLLASVNTNILPRSDAGIRGTHSCSDKRLQQFDMKTLFTAEAISCGGRSGYVESPDGCSMSRLAILLRPAWQGGGRAPNSCSPPHIPRATTEP